MDVGIFKASKPRLVAWIIIPPVVITSVGLSTFAMRQRAEWQLRQTMALSEILPEVIQARENIGELMQSLGLTEEMRISTGDQLLALLDEKATHRSIDVKRTQILQRDNSKESGIPVISAMLEASGDFSNIQLFLNDVRSAYPLVSARSIELSLNQDPEEDAGDFDIKLIFDLMLVNDVLEATGGSI